LRSCYFCAWDLDVGVGVAVELFVQGETDGLDGDVGAAGLLEEGTAGKKVLLVFLGSSFVGLFTRSCVPEDARRDVAAAANGDHEVGLEVIEDLVGRLLAELMDL
jgi:hypothetical protein